MPEGGNLARSGQVGTPHDPQAGRADRFLEARPASETVDHHGPRQSDLEPAVVKAQGPSVGGREGVDEAVGELDDPFLGENRGAMRMRPACLIRILPGCLIRIRLGCLIRIRRGCLIRMRPGCPLKGCRRPCITGS